MLMGADTKFPGHSAGSYLKAPGAGPTCGAAADGPSQRPPQPCCPAGAFLTPRALFGTQRDALKRAGEEPLTFRLATRAGTLSADVTRLPAGGRGRWREEQPSRPCRRRWVRGGAAVQGSTAAGGSRGAGRREGSSYPSSAGAALGSACA